MSARRISIAVWAVLALTLSPCVSSRATEGPVGVVVNIKALNLNWGSSGSGSLELSIDALNGLESTSAYPFDSATPQMSARLEPGKTYFLHVDSDDLGDLTLQAVPPPGYVMEIERNARERVVLEIGRASCRERV